MIDSIEWLRLFILENPLLGYLGVFFSAAFLGEYFLFIFGFFVTQGVMPIFSFVLLSFLGTLFSNTIWFLLGKSANIARVISHRYADATVSIITQTMQRISKDKHFGALVIIKFMVGTPFLLIMYVNKTNLSFKNFIYYEIPVIFLWLFVIIPISLLSGFGFIYLAEIFQNLYAAIGFVFSIIIFIIIFQIWFKKMFTHTPKFGVTPKGGEFTKIDTK